MQTIPDIEELHEAADAEYLLFRKQPYRFFFRQAAAVFYYGEIVFHQNKGH